MAFNDIEQTIYGGTVNLVYKDKSHRYYANGKAVTGVTTILGRVLAKPGLMTWPLDLAIKHIRTCLPVVTEHDLEVAAKAHITARDKGGNTGSIVHSLIEQDIMGKEPNYSGESEEVQLAMKAYHDWKKDSGLEILATEQVVYSKDFHYAGTYDAIVRDKDGKQYLLDFKTTNASREAPEGIYSEYFVQLGAYAGAHYEQALADEVDMHIDGLMVVSVKKTGVYHVKTNEDVGLSVEEAIDLWLNCLNLHNKMIDLKKALGGK